MTKTTEVFTFKRGEKYPLDQIMIVQGIAGGLWWEPSGDGLREGDLSYLSDVVVITRDITITITAEMRRG